MHLNYCSSSSGSSCAGGCSPRFAQPSCSVSVSAGPSAGRPSTRPPGAAPVTPPGVLKTGLLAGATCIDRRRRAEAPLLRRHVQLHPLRRSRRAMRTLAPAAGLATCPRQRGASPWRSPHANGRYKGTRQQRNAPDGCAMAKQLLCRFLLPLLDPKLAHAGQSAAAAHGWHASS